MGKLIKQAGEAAKVKVRHARKGAVDQTKDLPSEDDQKKAEKQVGSGACSLKTGLYSRADCAWSC